MSALPWPTLVVVWAFLLVSGSALGLQVYLVATGWPRPAAAPVYAARHRGTGRAPLFPRLATP